MVLILIAVPIIAIGGVLWDKLSSKSPIMRKRYSTRLPDAFDYTIKRNASIEPASQPKATTPTDQTKIHRIDTSKLKVTTLTNKKNEIKTVPKREPEPVKRKQEEDNDLFNVVTTSILLDEITRSPSPEPDVEFGGGSFGGAGSSGSWESDSSTDTGGGSDD